MSIVRRIFPSDADALRPRLAVEIMPYGVLAAVPGNVAVQGESQDVVTAYVALRVGAVAAGLKGTNLIDRAQVSAAIRQALEQVTSGTKVKSRQVTVVVPDAAVRVLLLDFDSLPAKAADILPILRFRLRKLVPFEVEDAAITYQVMQTPPSGATDSLVRTVVAVMPGSIRAEYEDAVREAGYEPGAVLSSSLACLSAVPNEGASLLVNRNANSVTTAISRSSELLLFRTLDFAESSIDPVAEALAVEELQQAVSVAVAYYEDTLSTSVPSLYSVGPGGCTELERLLADPQIRVKELVPGPPGASRSETAGMLAGVVGALAS
jgi:type IV pilus assembly protein PilM